MTEMQQANQNFLVKVRQEKRPDYHVQTLRKGSCQRGMPCNDWDVPERTKIKAFCRYRIRDKCAHKHTATHIPVSEGETSLELFDGPFPNFVSSASNVVHSHSNDDMVSPLRTAQHQHTRCQHRRLKAQPSGGCKERFSPFSRAICQSFHCLEQLYPKRHEVPLGRRLAVCDRRGAVVSWSGLQC